MQSFFPKSIEPATRYISEIQRGRAIATNRLRVHDEVCEVARELAAFAHVVGKSGAEQRAVQTSGSRNVHSMAVESDAVAALGGEQIVSQRIVNDSYFHSAFELQPNRNAKTRIAMRIICGAVQRIDDPTPIALTLSIGRLAGAGFFRQDRMLRIVSLDAIDDQLLGSQIRFGDQIQFALVGDSDRAAKAFGHQMTGVAGSLDGKVEQRQSLRSVEIVD